MHSCCKLVSYLFECPDNKLRQLGPLQGHQVIEPKKRRQLLTTKLTGIWAAGYRFQAPVVSLSRLVVGQGVGQRLEPIRKSSPSLDRKVDTKWCRGDVSVAPAAGNDAQLSV